MYSLQKAERQLDDGATDRLPLELCLEQCFQE
jgi:hypothetical protein